MAIAIKLPDMGEGIADVTISRWRVPVGSAVKTGDIILEVATDKVDSEVAAPADGTLLKVNFHEGELAPVDAALGMIGAAGESTDAAPAFADSAGALGSADAVTPTQHGQPAQPPPSDDGADVKASPVARRVAADKGVPLAVVTGTGPGGQITKNDVLAFTEQGDGGASAPLPGDLADQPTLVVRRAAADNNVDLREIAGGRPLSTLTKYDVLSAVTSRAAGKAIRVEPAFPPPSAVAWPATQTQAAQPATPAPATPAPAAPPARPAAAPTPTPGQLHAGEELVKHTRMRAAIAKNTNASAFTAPHVTTMWDVDVSAILAHRSANKGAFAKEGVNLTLTAYFVEAIVAGLRAVPAANASWTDEGVIIKRYYNVGMATALPMDANGLGGLIVPVIKHAGEMNLLGIARAVNGLAERARKNELRQDDLADGTFTLSNYGTGGSRFQTPVIVQPQVGILGVGAVEKRAVIVSNGHPLEANLGDALAIKPMTTLGFSYDHRVLDGATADAFCAAVRKFLEGYK